MTVAVSCNKVSVFYKNCERDVHEFYDSLFQKLLSFFHPKSTRVDKSDNNNTTNSTTNNIHNNMPIHEPINATSHDVYRTYNYVFA